MTYGIDGKQKPIEMGDDRMILHTYWPDDRPQSLKTRILEGDSLADAWNGLVFWWKSPIQKTSTTRDLDGLLHAVIGKSTVTLDNGYSVDWTHMVYRSERP